MEKTDWKQTAANIRDRFFSDDSQNRAFFHMVRFFLTMLLLTLAARGFAGAAMAKVEVTVPTQYTMSRNLYSSGSVMPSGTRGMTVPAGLEVVEVLLAPGAEVAEGDILATVEPEALDALLIRQDAALQQMKIQLEGLLDGQRVSDAGVKSAKRSLEQAESSQEQAQQALASAESALQQAEDDLAAAEEAVKNAAGEADLTPLEQAVTDAAAQVRSAESARDSAALQLESAGDQVVTAREYLDQVQESYNEALIQAQRNNESNKASAQVLQLDIAAAEEGLAALKEIRDRDCAILAAETGVLVQLPLTEEGLTTGTEEVVIATQSGGCRMTFQTDQENAQLLLAEAKRITVSQGELTELVSNYEAAPETLDDELVTFTATLRKPGWSPGSVSVTALLWENTYGTCVPVSALHQDSEGYFVYVVRTEQTLMGIENQTVRVGVQVERLDGEYAAVYGGLEGADQVIRGSNKPLHNGDRVRVKP